MTLNLQIKKAKINVINIDEYLYKLKKGNTLDQDIEKTYKRINAKLDNMFWYDAKVYRIIEGGMSIKELSRQSKISYYSLYRTYNKVKDILKNEIR
jgi:DNA invertase Pin-like site-specific DNA recombinase